MADSVDQSARFFAEETEGQELLDRFRSAINALGDGVFQLDGSGRFVAVNDAVVEVTGRSREQLLGSHVTTVLTDRAASRFEAVTHALVEAAAEEPVTIDVGIETAAGDQRRCEVQLSRTDGERSGTVGAVREVPDREPATAVDDAVGGRYESLVNDVLDGADVGVFVLDAEYRVAWVNEATERYFGLDRDAVVGRDKRTVVDEHVRDAVAAPDAFAERVFETYDGDTDVATFECHVEAGEERAERWLEHRSKPIESGCYAGGRVELYYDVTDRRRTDRALREETAFRESLFEAQPDIVYAFDAHGRVLRWNDRLAEVTGYDDAEIARMHALDFVPDEHAERATRAMEQVVVDGESNTVEIDVETADGERVPYQFSGAPIVDEGGEIVGLTGIGRDISRLRAQARRLERQRDELEAELDDVFARIDDAFYALDDEWRFAYVNDRAEELLERSAGELLGAVVWEAFSGIEDSELERAFREAMATQEAAAFEAYFEPLGAWFEVRAYPSETGLSVYFRDVSERKERERELERQRERLAVLDNLNGVVRGITDAVIEQSTREEIERIVCERLAAADSYEFAWIASVDSAAESMVPRVEAGVDGYLDEVPLSVDPDDPAGRGPTGRAVQTREIQVVRDALAESEFAPWRDYAREYGYRAAAAIPIKYGETLYGVLGVYTGREGAFAAEEREVVGGLGEIVGHAIAAVERKRALMSDEVLELEFHMADVLAELGVEPAASGEIALEQVVPVGGGDYVIYGSAPSDDLPVVEGVVDTLPSWEGIRTVGEELDRVRFEIRLSEPPVLTAVAARGGKVTDARLVGQDFQLTAQVPHSVEPREILDAVREPFPTAEVRAQRQVSRGDDRTERTATAFDETLTEKQRAALTTAYHAGYFEWPRESSGEEVAEALGISAATFSQHLRSAQNRIFEALLERRSVT